MPPVGMDSSQRETGAVAVVFGLPQEVANKVQCHIGEPRVKSMDTEYVEAHCTHETICLCGVFFRGIRGGTRS